MSSKFKGWFAQYQEAQGKGDVPVFRDLSGAKHRFATYCAPLRRLVLKVRALVMTAERILICRTKKENGYEEAETFLRVLSTEAYLQLAMMADAADETIVLLRYCDGNSMDTALMNFQVNEFASRITHLFVDAGCLHTPETFTAFAVKSLEQILSWKVGRDNHSLCGPPGTDMLTRTLGRMQCWQKLAMGVLRTGAESPSGWVGGTCHWAVGCVGAFGSWRMPLAFANPA